MNFDEGQVISKLKALESEHQTRIVNFSKKMESMRDEKGRLSTAIGLLKELDLIVPEEYSSRLSEYYSDVEKLKSETGREKFLLNYLQSRVLSASEERPPVSEVAKKVAEEITPVKAPLLAKPVAEFAAPVETTGFAMPSRFTFPDKYYKWLVVGVICLIIIAIAALFYISQWFR